jgi:hypothetical protein
MRLPRHLLTLLLACAGLTTACKGGGTYVVVAIQAGSGTPSGIRSIQLDLMMAGHVASATFTGPNGGDITLPTDGTLEIGSGAGDLTITAHARGANGQVLDTGTGHGIVSRDSTTHIVVQLGTGPGDGGAGGTGGSDGGGGSGGDGGPGNDGGPQPPMVVADSDSFDFGTVVTGNASAATVITVRNTGGQHTGTLIVGVVDAVTFPTSADTCNGNQLDPGASCTVSVTFQPASAGAKTTTLRVGGTPGGTVSVTLSGMGVDPGALAITPNQRDYGPIPQGQQSAETTFRVSNTGGAPTTALTAALTGSNSGEFLVSSDACSNTILQPNGVCIVGVKFAPAATGSVGAKSATVTVSATTGGTAVASLTGAALGPAALMVVPTDQDFGMVVQGLPSPEFQFTVTNGGGQTSGALTASISPPGEFAITSNTCGGATLQPAGTCKVGIKMTPAGLGGRAATLTVAGTPGGTALANLRGTGLSPGMIVISPSSKDFTTVDVGSPSPIQFTITNTGGGATTALSLTPSGATDFAVSNDMCSGSVLAAGGSCTFTVTFTPSTFGALSGSVTASAATGGTSTTMLSGTGRDYVTLTVTKSGTGGGTVAASGLTCTNNTCMGQYARTSTSVFQTVSVTAAPDALSTFGSWALACTGTGSCSVTMDSAKSVMATFTVKTVHVTINVIGLAGQTGAVVSDDGAISCNAPCGPITHNAASTITFTAKPNGTTSTFAGWASGPCVGTKAACAIPLTSDVSLTATFGPQSYMFVTSSLIVPGHLNGVAGADTECTNRATAAGLPGTYRAWISDKTAAAAIDANTRIGTGGWVRTDGRPFAPSLAGLKTVSGQIVYYPPRVDENGNDLGPTRIVVGTGGNSDGTNFGAQCGNYTTTLGSMYIGLAAGGSGYWAYNELDSTGCGDAMHLYCFRTDTTAAIAPPSVPNARRIFASGSPFTPGGGIAAADTQCQNDAKNAGFTTYANFVALLATSTTPAIARLNTTGLPWKRPDEVLVVLDPADLGRNMLVAPIDVTALIQYASRIFWSGSTDVNLPGNGNSCNDWMSGAATSMGYFGNGFAQAPDWFDTYVSPCNGPGTYLICAEK